jgi:hypothetical protein
MILFHYITALMRHLAFLKVSPLELTIAQLSESWAIVEF